MANTFTPLLGLVKQVPGENPDGIWGETLNALFMDLVDTAIAGRSDIDVTSGSVTLTNDVGAANQARAALLVIEGTPGVPRNVVVPQTEKFYVVSNESDDQVTIKTAIGAGVTLEVGDRVALYVDQTLNNVFQLGSVGNAITPAGPFGLPGQPGTITNSSPAVFPQFVTTQQGNIATGFLPLFATQTVNDTVFEWVKTDIPGGTPDGSQYTPAPAEDFLMPIAVVENGTLRECVAIFQADGLKIRIQRCDGNLWTNGSTRTISYSGFPPYPVYSVV